VIRSSSNGRGTIKASKEGMESRKRAEKEGGHISARILVVDDDEVECRVLESLLVGAGHQAQSCLSSQEAIAKLKEDPFDLVITDLKMPGIHGLDILREAKELDPFCEVIVITACASVESAVEAMKLGACDYISRPFNVDQMRRVVDKAVEKRRLLRVDGSTEIYDRRVFYALLEAEIARSHRYARPLSVLMMGLDDLKAYDDTLGHPAGGAMLQEVACLLRKSVRKCDVVARHEGDKFTVILVETNKMGAITAANRLCRLVKETDFEHDDVSPHKTLTISIGVAGYPTDAAEEVELVSKADQALREGKTLGGNLVRTAGQELALTRTYHRKWLYFLCKRCMDIILSLLFLIITLPLMLLIALLIKVDSPGPVFFKQERVGPRKRSIGGQQRWELSTFIMYKFRTMYHDCNPRIHQQLVKALIRRDEDEWARLGNHTESVVKKVSNDPRITRVGKVLRKTTIDEWPQLWNVLRGEMSLVGPRPAIVYEVAEYEPRHRRRLETIPGCTGFWQVSGWNALGFEEMVELDIQYIEHQSLWLDILILLRTVPAVLLRKGGG